MQNTEVALLHGIIILADISQLGESVSLPCEAELVKSSLDRRSIREPQAVRNTSRKHKRRVLLVLYIAKSQYTSRAVIKIDFNSNPKSFDNLNPNREDSPRSDLFSSAAETSPAD